MGFAALNPSQLFLTKQRVTLMALFAVRRRLVTGVFTTAAPRDVTAKKMRPYAHYPGV
jgi:hypothetical protein